MLSINMRIFKTVLLLSAVLGYGVECSPTEGNSVSPEEIETADNELAKPVGDHYDQRQNGSENYRVHVDGLAFIIAPADAVFMPGHTSNISSLGLNDLNIAKPDKTKPEVDGEKPQPLPKNVHRSGIRLQDLIIPLIRRLRRQ